MNAIESDKFKNLASKRFFEFFYEKLKSKVIDVDKFYEEFQVSNVSNRSVFLNALKYGQKGVTIEQVSTAFKKYGVHPDYLFGVTDQATTDGDYVMQEPEAEFESESRTSVGEKLKAIFEKHKINISQYAEQRLKMTEQNLYKILRGEGRPFWDVIVTICEDLGESLDQFRRNPLPKGHLLQQVKTQQQLIEVLQKRVGELEGK